MKGKAYDAPKSLVELLSYMEDTRPEKACNEKLARIQSFVDELKKDPKVEEAYLMFNDYVMSERREAAAEANKRAEEEKKRAEEADKRAEKEKKKAEEEKKKAEEAFKKAQESNRSLENLLSNLRTRGMSEEMIREMMASGAAVL